MGTHKQAFHFHEKESAVPSLLEGDTVSRRIFFLISSIQGFEFLAPNPTKHDPFFLSPKLPKSKTWRQMTQKKRFFFFFFFSFYPRKLSLVSLLRFWNSQKVTWWPTSELSATCWPRDFKPRVLPRVPCVPCSPAKAIFSIRPPFRIIHVSRSAFSFFLFLLHQPMWILHCWPGTISFLPLGIK